MSDYAERQAQIRKENRKRARKRRWEDRLVGLLVILGGLGGLLGLIAFLAVIGSIGIYAGWNLGVYGLAHAVHTNVLHIGYWTAFGASFAIGVIRRMLSGDASVSLNQKA